MTPLPRTNDTANPAPQTAAWGYRTTVTLRR
jgi:hypothetical protein